MAPAYIQKDGKCTLVCGRAHAHACISRHLKKRRKGEPAVACHPTRPPARAFSQPSLHLLSGRVRQAPPPWYTPAGFMLRVRTFFTALSFFLRSLFSPDAAGDYRRWSLARSGGGGSGGGGGPGGRGGGRVFGLGQLNSVSAVPGGCTSCAGG